MVRGALLAKVADCRDRFEGLFDGISLGLHLSLCDVGDRIGLTLVSCGALHEVARVRRDNA